jgi:16S rRNA (adenine1518-N6/adenine1519-N6)-dimethyltransferase
VTAIEIDRRLSEELTRSIRAKNFRLIERDALEVDWPDLARAARDQLNEALSATGTELVPIRVRVVANLPYYISTAIIERLLTTRPGFFDLTLMLQEEVVDRIISQPGGRDYGFLSVLVQYYSDPVKMFVVPPNAFRPAPKVNSAIVRLAVRDTPAVEAVDETRFFQLVRAAFAHRRKTILNNLKAAAGTLQFSRPPESALEMASMDHRRRAETLSLSDFATLSWKLWENSSGAA